MIQQKARQAGVDHRGRQMAETVAGGVTSESRSSYPAMRLALLSLTCGLYKSPLTMGTDRIR
jgi:hypothetical protein